MTCGKSAMQLVSEMRRIWEGLSEWIHASGLCDVPSREGR